MSDTRPNKRVSNFRKYADRKALLDAQDNAAAAVSRLKRQREKHKETIDDLRARLAEVAGALAIGPGDHGPLTLGERVTELRERAEEAERARDEWARQCNLASEHQADTAAALSKATARLAEVEKERDVAKRDLSAWLQELDRARKCMVDSDEAAVAAVAERDALRSRLERLETAAREIPCPRCGGTGKVDGHCDDPHCESCWKHECGRYESEPCTDCKGSGKHPALAAALEVK